MQFILVLICMTLISTIEAIYIPKMPKPKLALTFSVNKTEIEITIRKPPEERRKLAIFPKHNKKYLIEAQLFEKPRIRTTKKPLMKKIKIQNNVLEPVQQNLMINDKQINVSQSFNPKQQDRENPEIIKESSEENNDINDIGVEEEVQTEIYPINESFHENTEFNEDNIQKRPKVDNVKFDDQVDDWNEFLFLDPVNSAKNNNDVVFDELEDSTEVPIDRIKRSDNVIVEENLGTTISGYKFTWHDTRLTNDLLFKNIHS